MFKEGLEDWEYKLVSGVLALEHEDLSWVIRTNVKKKNSQGMVVHSCNGSIRQAETGRFMWLIAHFNLLDELWASERPYCKK